MGKISLSRWIFVLSLCPLLANLMNFKFNIITPTPITTTTTTTTKTTTTTTMMTTTNKATTAATKMPWISEQPDFPPPPGVSDIAKPGACEPIGNSDDIDFTLVVQTSEDRLWLLEHYCSSWKGPISIAVYTDRSPESLRQEILGMGCGGSSGGGTKVTGASSRSKNKINDDENPDDDLNATMNATRRRSSRKSMMTKNNTNPTADITVNTNATRQPKDANPKDDGPSPSLVVQTLSPRKTNLTMVYYPTNQLRNLALSGIRTTSHGALLDIDFFPSHDLWDILHQRNVRQVLASDPRQLLVIPAFEYVFVEDQDRQKKKEDMPTSKSSSSSSSSPPPSSSHQDQAIKYIDQMPLTYESLMGELDPETKDIMGGCHATMATSNDTRTTLGENHQKVSPGVGGAVGASVKVFHSYFRPAHDSTDYAKWGCQQGRGSVEPIPCIRSPSYEPYVVFQWCRDLPPFQPAFKGYGFNKSSWIIHLRHLNYKFSQLGGAFALHFPHPDSPARQFMLGSRWQRLLRTEFRSRRKIRDSFSEFLRKEVAGKAMSQTNHTNTHTSATPMCRRQSKVGLLEGFILRMKHS